MPTTSLLYRIAVRAAVPCVPAVLRDSRQRAAHAARVAAPAAMTAWAKEHRDRTRPLVWFHASSVGEGLQARAVLAALRDRRPEAQFAYSHYSPSAEALAARMPVDWAGYLPYDRVADVERALDALAPDLLVFAKLDLWPELASRAVARGVQVALVAATVRPGSGRLAWPVRECLAPGYRALAVAGAISPDDAARLAVLGCPQERITVTGDPRVDAALDLVDEAATEPPVLPGDPATTLIAGSTWPADDSALLDAFARVRSTHPGARLIVAPHDPTPDHLDGIDQLARHHHLPAPVRLSALGDTVFPAIVAVDRVGVLARLYRVGAMAYVGGGWGTKGIHSVLEPAAWGRPVIVGPEDLGNRDVARLRAAGALSQLPRTDAARALATMWSGWLTDDAAREHAGRVARAALEAERGAAVRSAALLRPLVGKT